ncbi:hypothetical protein EDEG_00090 [Edhazardia aedis USNM 41457]|uniref:Uncharacterized protein n=1 Tax=Edhazardia aedis (strain USNM 41457) TaxID=1003232 RepID=J8ZZ60_EDHAE|nr:hypothetical protein EDEG_00090 [Edhazardia aedis USNM 41457]|eukprot:EJW04973.1 hypothetical protein EDEG_00090 [Edhazardia aedis USNM 41457]
MSDEKENKINQKGTHLSQCIYFLMYSLIIAVHIEITNEEVLVSQLRLSNFINIKFQRIFLLYHQSLLLNIKEHKEFSEHDILKFYIFKEISVFIYRNYVINLWKCKNYIRQINLVINC